MSSGRRPPTRAGRGRLYPVRAAPLPPPGSHPLRSDEYRPLANHVHSLHPPPLGLSHPGPSKKPRNPQGPPLPRLRRLRLVGGQPLLPLIMATIHVPIPTGQTVSRPSPLPSEESVIQTSESRCMSHWDYAYPLEPIDVRTTQWMMPPALRYCSLRLSPSHESCTNLACRVAIPYDAGRERML
jgi:hypothetical protein